LPRISMLFLMGGFFLWVVFNPIYCLGDNPKRLAGIEVGDCKACHGNTTVLPEGHDSTNKQTVIDCNGCHSDPCNSLRGKMPLNHLHQLAGVNCAMCHQKQTSFSAVLTQQCLACHGGIEKIVEKTSQLDPNPHNSPHYGSSLDCDLCHHHHVRSENFCNQCHEFNRAVP